MTKRKAAPAAINTPASAPTLPERIRYFVQQLMARAAQPGPDGEPDMELGGLAVALAMVANDAEEQLAALAFQRDLAAVSGQRPWSIEQAAAAARKHYDRAGTAEARIAAVRALHHAWDGADPACCAHCQDGQGTPLPYPCPTIQALDGAEGSDR
jgi:hypothetical protein